MRRLAAFSAVLAILIVEMLVADAVASAQSPTIDGVFPSAGATAGTVTIGFSATGLDSSSTLLLNGQPQTTLSVEDGTPDMLFASVPFSLISIPGTASLQLTSVNGSLVSEVETFFIPMLSPTTVLNGPGEVVVSITTSDNFFCDDPSDVGTCDGQARLEIVPDSFVNAQLSFQTATEATITLPAGAVATPGLYAISFRSNKDGSTTLAGAAVFTVVDSMPMLTVVKTGSGDGIVTSSTGGIGNCGSTCMETFTLTSPAGQEVTLTAAAAAGSTFAGWSGGGCSGTDPCTFTITADTTISASFVPAPPPGPPIETITNLVAAVLPSSRSVQVASAATAFATIINPAAEPALACSPALPQGLAGIVNYTYQTTNPLTNQTTGTLNTPADIAPGALQSFVVSLTPTAAFAPMDVALVFDCFNSAPAAALTGINTLLLSASPGPVPDVVALAATLNGDGIVNVAGPTGTGVFAVASVNVGASGQITVSADTGGALLPLGILICETNPAVGNCLNAMAPTVTTQIDAGATPTFGIFLQGAGFIPFDPASIRIYVRFRDAGGLVRGSTSVAARTQ
ncbi:MAG: InlB B-repeat-containing protein [Candidatus Rokuibacteriota bacterium]